MTLSLQQPPCNFDGGFWIWVMQMNLFVYFDKKHYLDMIESAKTFWLFKVTVN